MGHELHLKIYLDLRMPSIPDCSLIVAHLAAHIYVPTDTVATGLIRVICNLQCYVYGVVQLFSPLIAISRLNCCFVALSTVPVRPSPSLFVQNVGCSKTELI